ncbi:hypothetical protein Ddc_10218 [Ditylenchus destructor]|nr:hypothetical protein Ddc_10218 [Ditylenchus destructor]
MPRSRLPRMKQERRTLNPTNSHPSNSTIPELKELIKLELLLDKLKIQFYFCFGGILFTILGYLIISSNSQCCELPFQESSCVVKSVMPLTNHSTLAEEVDEFIASARAITFNLHDAVEIPSLTDRQKTLEITDYELWQLIEQHSANLAAFGVIKREDERMEELEEANARQKKVKRQIPIFYMATLICFLVQLGLYAAFFKSQYYTGHCPLYDNIERRRGQTLRSGEKYLAKSFSDYHTFADKLQLTLDLHLEELNKTIQSPNLELREIGWKYEYYAIEAAFRHHHSELKQYLGILPFLTEIFGAQGFSGTGNPNSGSKKLHGYLWNGQRRLDSRTLDWTKKAELDKAGLKYAGLDKERWI